MLKIEKISPRQNNPLSMDYYEQLEWFRAGVVFTEFSTPEEWLNVLMPIPSEVNPDDVEWSSFEELKPIEEPVQVEEDSVEILLERYFLMIEESETEEQEETVVECLATLKREREMEFTEFHPRKRICV